MKSITCLMGFFAILASSFMLHAQEQMAFINEEGEIELPSNVPLSDVYSVDISTAGFDSAEAVRAYFKERTTEDIHYRVLPDQNRIVVILSTKMHPQRTTSQWSTRLREVADFQEVSPISKSN